MKIERSVIVWVAVMMLVGCGGEERAEGPVGENVEDAIVEAVNEQTGESPSNDQQPCEILDDELLRAHFEIPESVEVARDMSQYSADPLCTVSWDKPNAEEIRADNSSKRLANMQARMRGEDVEPLPKAANTITLTLYRRPFENSERALASFEASMRSLSEGITVSTGESETTFQRDTEPVEGVGEKAMWVPEMRQLSVVSGNHIFHVGVNTGAALSVELEKAKAIAADVAAKL